MHVLLYTRVGCHLCQDAKALLVRHGLQPQEIDIDRDPDLRQQYNDCVPVVVIDGKVRFRGRVDERLLLRLLKARSRP
jgi:glutaredoxin